MNLFNIFNDYVRAFNLRNGIIFASTNMKRVLDKCMVISFIIELTITFNLIGDVKNELLGYTIKTRLQNKSMDLF